MRPARLAAALLALFLGLAASGAHAQEESPRYTYLEGGWIRTDPDGPGGTEDGLFAAGSLGLGHLHILGEYADHDEGDEWELGAGVRWMVVSAFELEGYLNYLDLDFQDGASLRVDGLWNILKWLSLAGSYEAGEDYDRARVYVRFTFR